MSITLVVTGGAPHKSVGPGAIGILGGAFDPVQNAHLTMARAALASVGVSKVLWIPSGRPPHRDPAFASAADRVAMLRLAIQGEPRFELDEREIRKTSPCYTVETLEELRAERGPDTDLVLLMGADQYERFETWHRWREIPSLARIGLFARPPHRLVIPGNAFVVPMPGLDISSTAIRKRIAAGEPVGGMVPAAVLDYIESHRLYSSREHKTL